MEKFVEREGRGMNGLVAEVVLGANYVWFGLISFMKPYKQSLRLTFFFGTRLVFLKHKLWFITKTIFYLL